MDIDTDTDTGPGIGIGERETETETQRHEHGHGHGQRQKEGNRIENFGEHHIALNSLSLSLLRKERIEREGERERDASHINGRTKLGKTTTKRK